jgi:hypothetical protein
MELQNRYYKGFRVGIHAVKLSDTHQTNLTEEDAVRTSTSYNIV